jgi:hypothetical protein
MSGMQDPQIANLKDWDCLGYADLTCSESLSEHLSVKVILLMGLSLSAMFFSKKVMHRPEQVTLH